MSESDGSFARLQREAWRDRRLPEVAQVAQGIWAVPVPCEDFPIRYTLCYIVVGSLGSFVVIDPGVDAPPARAALHAGMREAGVDPARLSAVLVTHLHPDHIGLAGELADRTHAPVLMHPLEVEGARESEDRGAVQRRLEAWLDTCGVPDSERAGLAAPHPLEVLPPLARVETVVDGDVVRVDDRELVILHTPGHTPGHLCVVEHATRVVFTGDHVLPAISPNIGIPASSSGRRDSIEEYLGSLGHVSRWPDYRALPAHQYAFDGIADRCAELAAGVERRGREIAAISDSAAALSVWDIAASVGWSRGWENLDRDNRRAALGETLAHLRHLHRQSAVTAR